MCLVNGLSLIIILSSLPSVTIYQTGSIFPFMTPEVAVRLVYIDDVCASLLKLLDGNIASGFHGVPVEFNTTVGEVANIISSFESSRTTLTTERVGARTYASAILYLPQLHPP